MYKQSYYNFFVDNILYNSLSNAIVEFKDSELCYIKDFLENIDDYYENNWNLINAFEKLGFICKSDFNELSYILFQNRIATLMNKNCRLTINPTLQCNYKCWYCCVEDQNTKYEDKRMDDHTIEKIKKHIFSLIYKEKITQLILDWFGGEPLMYFKEVILPISKYGIELCQKNKIPFFNHVTTNAYYINSKMIENFNAINMTSFQIPIDGNEKKHNSIKNIGGVGHYKQIISSINSLCENVENCRITLRINYDKQTLKSITDIIKDIKTINRNKITVDFQRVWQVELNKNESGNNKFLIETKRIFEEAGFKTMYFAYFPKQFQCCYADSFYHRVINYDGRIFKCSARDYDKSLEIGSLENDGTIIYKPIINELFADSTFKNEKCLACKKLPLCFGPCIQKYYETKIKDRPFQCLHEASEISFEEYVKNLNLKMKKLNNINS